MSSANLALVATVATLTLIGRLRRHTVTPVPPSDLVTTPDAARALGISSRTLQRYVSKGVVTPEITLPSGQYRWDVAKLRAQIEALSGG